MRFQMPRPHRSSSCILKGCLTAARGATVADKIKGVKENMSLTKEIFSLADSVEFECWIFIIQRENGDREFWFKAHDVARFLEYKNPTQAIRQNVHSEWRKEWSYLKGRFCIAPFETPLNWQPHSVFVNESGLYALAIRSRKPDAVKFQNWVHGEVLPSLRRDGVYSMKNTHMEGRMDKLESDMSNLTTDVRERVVEIENERAVMTEEEETRHTFTLFRKRKIEEDDEDGTEFLALRCQERNLEQARRRMKDRNSYEEVLYRENVPNAINILSRSKEIMKDKNVHYKAWSNKVRTTDPARFEQIVTTLADADRTLSTSLAGSARTEFTPMLT